MPTTRTPSPATARAAAPRKPRTVPELHVTSPLMAGAAVLGSLFFVRVHVWPLLPVVLLLSLRRARSWAERALIGALMVVPPMIFLACDTHHVKLLASMPVVGHLVRRLGYVPFVQLDERP